MTNQEQVQALMQEWQRLQGIAAGGVVEITEAPAPVTVIPMEATVSPVVAVPVGSSTLVVGSPASAQAAAAAIDGSKKKKKEKPAGNWVSQKITLTSGDVLECRVAPKGYGTVGFVQSNEYVNFYGYKERMEGLCHVFGPGFKTIVFDWMCANGLKTRAEVFAS